jgi:PIN domain
VYYLILDSNIWIAERLLRSALGSATLYCLAKSGSLIALPEIVKQEVDRRLVEQTEMACDTIRKSSELLQQISGYRMSTVAPSQEAVKKGINRRWNELSGVIGTIEFTIEHARGALQRIIQRTPPCSQNNEQFRDCFIWQCAIELAQDAPVHLVSNDHAFYQGQDPKRGLSSGLKAEAQQLGRIVHLYPNLSEFLAVVDQGVPGLDEATIREAIVSSVAREAGELANNSSKGWKFELGAIREAKITGYATPEPSVVAVSFSVDFDLTLAENPSGSDTKIPSGMTVEGECSYDPQRNAVLGVRISGWSKYLREKGGAWSSELFDPRSKELYAKGNIRIL